MSWWQWILILIGTVAAGALIGILVGYLFLRLRKKDAAKNKPAASRPAPVNPNPPPIPAAAKTPKSYLIKEVEANLAIAAAEWKGKLTAFRTEVMDSNRSFVNALPAELREEITEAYTDMHLTNTLVTLSKEDGHSQKDLEESYLRLRKKVADRLNKIRPEL